MRSKNNKTELLNPEEGEDNMGDGIGEELLGDQLIQAAILHRS